MPEKILFVRTNKHTGRRFKWSAIKAGARSKDPPHYAMLEAEEFAFTRMLREKLSTLDFDKGNATLTIEPQ